MLVFWLLVAYAVCFGIQHKTPFLQERFILLDRLLVCTYCTGFHAGWITRLLAWQAMPLPKDYPALAAELITWALASAAFCYVVDAAVKWFEVNSAE